MAIDYISKQESENMTGLKLDGRKRYFIWKGEVCTESKWTQACSGCANDSEYSASSSGTGCHECGYTGKRRSSFPIPVKIDKEQHK